jgi:hypothetical protein
MKRVLKWILSIVLILIMVGFLAFLYFIPPFFVAPPESFSKPEADARPALDDITDPGERAIAEHGKYIVGTFGCADCHTPVGDQGPDWDRYLSGGTKLGSKGVGIFVARNLTPDSVTGLGRRTNEQVLRVLRTGLLPDGRIAFHRIMPWVGTTNLTEEDRYAVLVYMRHVKSVHHTIPEDVLQYTPSDPNAIETFHAGDYGTK